MSPCFSVRERADVGIGLESFRSVMNAADLGVLRGSFFILAEFCMVLAASEERVYAPLTGCVGVYEEAMMADLRFSLHPFVVKLLDRYVLSLAQIVPNSWRYIVGFLSLYSLHGRRPTISLFQACFSLKKHPRGRSWWYFSQRSNRKLVLGVPSSIHGWKKCFFL